MKKRIIALLLSGMMATSLLMGCEMTDSTKENITKVENTDKSVEINEDVVTLDLYIDETWFPTDSWTGIIPEELTKNGGVYFDVTRSADDSQLGLMIASGDLPDLVFTDKEIDRLCDSNVCYSYDELIEKYGIDWTPSEDRIGIARSHNADPNDEHYYTIIQNYNTNEEWSKVDAIPNLACLFYRKDIWEELGAPTMETLDDVVKVCELVKEKYPDMIPINAGGPNWRLTPFQQWMGVGNEFIYLDNGTVSFRDTTNEFKEYLTYVNQLYRKGLFPEENLAITNEDDAKQMAINGKCFMYEWCTGPKNLIQLNNSLQENIEDGEWSVMQIPDNSRTIVGANAGWAGVFISKSCKNPEAAIRMIAYMNSQEGQHLALWGREGIDYTLNEKGLPEFSDEWKEASQDGDVMTSKYNGNYFLCTTSLDEAGSNYSGVDPEVAELFLKNSDKYINYPELSIALPLSTSDMGIIRAKILETREAELVKIYTCSTDEEFENTYQDYIKLLDRMGVQELNEYMNEKVIEVKKEFGF